MRMRYVYTRATLYARDGLLRLGLEQHKRISALIVSSARITLCSGYSYVLPVVSPLLAARVQLLGDFVVHGDDDVRLVGSQTEDRELTRDGT